MHLLQSQGHLQGHSSVQKQEQQHDFIYLALDNLVHYSFLIFSCFLVGTLRNVYKFFVKILTNLLYISGGRKSQDCRAFCRSSHSLTKNFLWHFHVVLLTHKSLDRLMGGWLFALNAFSHLPSVNFYFLFRFNLKVNFLYYFHDIKLPDSDR